MTTYAHANNPTVGRNDQGSPREEQVKNAPTFKKHPRATGLAGIGDKPQIVIKLRKKVVGVINQPNFFRGLNNWQIGFMVIKDDIMEDGNSNCPWRWKFMKNDATDEETARSWVRINFEKIVAQNALRNDDD
jgi:hypothetical protein